MTDRNGSAIVLCYHRVTEKADDPLSLCVHPDRFSAQVERLRGFADVVPLADIHRAHYFCGQARFAKNRSNDIAGANTHLGADVHEKARLFIRRAAAGFWFWSGRERPWLRGCFRCALSRTRG